MIKKGMFLLVIAVTQHVNANNDYSGVISTIEVIAQTTSGALNCMDWTLTGGCAWLRCTVLPPSCSVAVSPKVKHFIPEAIVQVYDRAYGEPWNESQLINSLVQGSADSFTVETLVDVTSNLLGSGDVDADVDGGVSTSGKVEKRASLNFKLVDVYGNPALPAFNQILAQLSLSCESIAVPFVPYFISNLDSASWRFNQTEVFFPQSWNVISNTHNLSSGLFNNYGAIYPRHGFMTTDDPLKAAVLAAFRAMHIVTRDNQPHVYLSLQQSSKDHYRTPPPLDKTSSRSGEWQMLYPDEEDSCKKFPMGPNEGSSKRSDDGSYVWNFWREFECCRDRGTFLGDVDL